MRTMKIRKQIAWLRRRCLALAVLAMAATPLALAGAARAQVFTTASTGESNSKPPQLGCFNTVGCNFIYNAGINGIVVQINCTENLYPTAIYSTTSAGGYTDSGMLCGSFTVTLAGGGSASYYCGYDGPGAPCSSL